MKIPFHLMMFKSFHAQRNVLRKEMHELSPGQPKILRYVATHQNCMLKDIASSCDIECATVSKILNALEEKEFLEKEVSKNNKRALCLRITEKGEKALRQWNLHCEEVEQLSLKGFSEIEKEQFYDYLNRMYENLSGKEMD